MSTSVVVGLGRIGAGFQRDPRRTGVVSHAEAWYRHPATALVGGVDPDPQQRRLFQEAYGVPAFATWQQLTAHCAPNFVSVCTPPSTHAETVLQVLQDGVRRIICEKPCTLDAAAAQSLLEQLGSRAEIVGVNFTRRYDPLHRQLFSRAAATTVTGGFGRYGAGLLNTASHWFDGLRNAGAEVEEVLSMPTIGGDDPTPTVVARLAEGGTVMLLAGDVAEYMVFETDLFTHTGRVRLSGAGSDGELFEQRLSPRFSEHRELAKVVWAPFLGMSNSMLNVIDDAISSWEDDRPMRCTISDAIAAHRILDAVRRSLYEGTWAIVAR